MEFKLAVFNTIRNIKYKPGWEIILGDDGNRLFLQVEATTLDVEPVTVWCEDAEDFISNHEEVAWKGGKRYLSPHMCRQEIVGICFDLIKAAEDHELREWFRYRGTRIYCPHIDPDWLAENATEEAFNVRENAMTMEEGDGTRLYDDVLDMHYDDLPGYWED